MCDTLLMLRFLTRLPFTFCITAALSSAIAGCTPDHEILRNCEVDEPCFPSNAEFVEGWMRSISLPGARCVMQALRDRTPGRYLHSTGTIYDYSRSAGTDTVIVVSPSGEARYAGVHTGYGDTGPRPPPTPAQRCQLKPPSYYQACLDALDAFNSRDPDDPAWRCMFGGAGSWLDGCVIETPARCE